MRLRHIASGGIDIADALEIVPSIRAHETCSSAVPRKAGVRLVATSTPSAEGVGAATKRRRIPTPPTLRLGPLGGYRSVGVYPYPDAGIYAALDV